MSGKCYFIDECKEEVAGPNIQDNKKSKKVVTLEEIKTVINEVNTLIFMNDHDNLLKPITQEEVLKQWDKEFIYNIKTSDFGSVDDYPNGYFYYVDVWDMGDKAKLLYFLCNTNYLKK
ncbi:hypothetical protein [Priestia aryabhattai]